MEAVGTYYIYMLYDSIIIHYNIYILWYMCQICERVTLARLSCPERSRPKDGVSPIVVVVPVAELAAEPWLMLMCVRRKEQHCSAPAGPRVLHWALVTIHAARCDILNWWWRHVKTIGTTSGSYWLKNRRVGDSTSGGFGLATWPIAGCCRLPGLRSKARDKVAWKRRLKLRRRKVLRFWMRPDISSTFQTRCSWIYMDLWDYYILLIFMMQRNCV